MKPWSAALALVLAACGNAADRQREAAQTQQNDVPVAINGESPFQYPAELYDQGVEGEVRLKLFVDALGRVVPESTQIAASSGIALLDSAAVEGAVRLRFAPAHRDGQPVAAVFVQPVIFRKNAAPAATPPSPAGGTVN